MSDTLAQLLSQRTRSLQHLLGRSKGSLNFSSFYLDRPQEPTWRNENKKRKYIIKGVGDLLSAAIDIILSTVDTARRVFGNDAHISTKPLIGQRLDSVQSDENCANSPFELVDTPAILASLPSSTQLRLLPADIQTYRPFIDSDAQSAYVPPHLLSEMVVEWFVKSIGMLEEYAAIWLGALEFVAEIWIVRMQAIGDIAARGSAQLERERMEILVDEACALRAQHIWTQRVSRLEVSIASKLSSLLEAVEISDSAAAWGAWCMFRK